MTDGAARAALRREVIRCAAAARSEAEFFAGLTAAGLLTRLRHSPDRPGRAAGYAVSLPGLTHYRDGQQVWYGGQTLDRRLSLAALRGRWRAGRPGAAPGADLFAGQAASDIYRYAALAAADATRQLHPAGSAQSGDVAWAAADLLTAAAEATGSTELRSAADWFARAGRAPWGRTPAPSPGGLMLRTAAHLLAACSPGGWQRQVTRAGLLTALTGLARAGRLQSLGGVGGRHPDVGHHQVRRDPPDLLQQPRAVTGLAHHLEAGVLEQAGQALPEQHVVFGQYHPQPGHGRAVSVPPGSGRSGLALLVMACIIDRPGPARHYRGLTPGEQAPPAANHNA